MGAPSPLALAGLRLANEQPLRRKPTRPAARLTDDYLARYDDRTLIYDVFEAADGQGAWAVCPRLLNLARPLLAGLHLDGAPVAAKRHVWLRAEALYLPGAKAGQDLSVTMDGQTQSLRIRRSRATGFAGRRALLAISKDNPLDALQDWAKWHAHHHGADAALLFDNGSTTYGVADAQAALQAGLGEDAVVEIVSAPFPYGPRDKGRRFDVSPRFLQTAMLNIARLDMLAQAASVLSVDIDELVRPVAGGSVFAEAERARLGVVGLPGQWVYSQHEPPQPHGAHIWHRPSGAPCNVKWCAVPQRGLGKRPWMVHRFAEPFFRLAMRRDLGFWHFRQVTTGWKSPRTHSPADLRRHQGLLEALQDAGLEAGTGTSL